MDKGVGVARGMMMESTVFDKPAGGGHNVCGSNGQGELRSDTFETCHYGGQGATWAFRYQSRLNDARTSPKHKCLVLYFIRKHNLYAGSGEMETRPGLAASLG